MILNIGSVLVQWRPCSRTKTLCLASPSATADHLRQQLDNLHKEADNTRVKANNARLRLLRLSEAVEKLRRQAAVSVQTGKENDARDLLFQKKKVMQAMEKLKSRIELFDELSAKLNEAISMKESLLIGNMSLDLDVSEHEAPSPIRIVSPTDEKSNTLDDEQHSELNNPESGEPSPILIVSSTDEKSNTLDDEQHSELNSLESGKDNQGFQFHSEKELKDERPTGDDDDVQVLRKIYTCNDFMKYIDQQLNQIELELETFLRYSNLILGHKEKPEYSKVDHVTEIIVGVRHIRERIASLRQVK